MKTVDSEIDALQKNVGGTSLEDTSNIEEEQEKNDEQEELETQQIDGLSEGESTDLATDPEGMISKLILLSLFLSTIGRRPSK